jgi:alanine racemase
VIGGLRISLSALQHNAETLRALVGPHHAAFVVKGNAYGHGMVETALAVERFATKFCVYSAEEAFDLRDGGITAPILILGPIPHLQLQDAIDAGDEIALWDTKTYVRDVAAAAAKGQTRAKVHIKVNSGLNRLGLAPDDLPDAAELYASIPDLDVTGVFSHLASAEEIDSPFTMLQLERFTKACDRAEPAFAAAGARPIRHIAASAAAMLWPQTRLDLSRFGIALYGLWPSAQTREAMNGNGLDLQPALSYETKLVTIREIDAGEPVGYGNTFHAPRRMRVGVIPVGYADGIPRALSNKGCVIVDGVRAPIIGRVAMNMTTVDITSVPAAHGGSQVVLIGRSNGIDITADDWAGWCDTINYEIVTRLPSTLTRSYE